MKTRLPFFLIALVFAGSSIFAGEPSLEKTLQIQGSKPFGTGASLLLVETATKDSIFCRESSGAPKSRTQVIQYPSDLSNRYVFMLSDGVSDFCEYELSQFYLELAHTPPDLTYQSLPIIIRRDGAQIEGAEYLGALEKVSCRVQADGTSNCLEQVNRKVRNARVTPWWVDVTDFERGTVFEIHLWTRETR